MSTGRRQRPGARLVDLLARGTAIVERAGVRLNPATLVEDVASSSLAGHPSPTIEAAVEQHVAGSATK